jgi:Protein of unknown function (DUF3303)
MKFLVTWTIEPANIESAQQRFVEKGGQYGEDVHLLGQWHSVNGLGGWSVVEAKSAIALTTWLDAWNDLLEISITPVVDIQEAAEFLARKLKPAA